MMTVAACIVFMADCAAADEKIASSVTYMSWCEASISYLQLHVEDRPDYNS